MHWEIHSVRRTIHQHWKIVASIWPLFVWERGREYSVTSPCSMSSYELSWKRDITRKSRQRRVQGFGTCGLLFWLFVRGVACARTGASRYRTTQQWTTNLLRAFTLKHKAHWSLDLTIFCLFKKYILRFITLVKLSLRRITQCNRLAKISTYIKKGEWNWKLF